MTPEMQIKLLYLMLNMTFSKKANYPLLLNGTNQILLLEIPLALDFSKRTCQSLLYHLQTVFNCYNCKGIKHLIRLCLGLSHLNEHKLKHSFQDALHPFCSCYLNVETNNTYVFISCPLFNNQRCTLLSTVSDTYSSMTNTSDLILTHILLFGKALLDISVNTFILKAAMNYII